MTVNHLPEGVDEEARLALEWCRGMNKGGRGNAELDALIREAYIERKYHRKSNGCNLVNELRWPFPRHPACVVHDMLYGDKRGRSYSDKMMRRLNSYFGRPLRAWTRWAGLRVGGWYVYYFG